jgi:hypothetical protein
MTLAKRHLDLREIRPGIDYPHAKKLRETALPDHRLGNGPGRCLRASACGLSCLFRHAPSPLSPWQTIGSTPLAAHHWQRHLGHQLDRSYKNRQGSTNGKD